MPVARQALYFEGKLLEDGSFDFMIRTVFECLNSETVSINEEKSHKRHNFSFLDNKVTLGPLWR
jgi:hypothetical protein